MQESFYVYRSVARTIATKLMRRLPRLDGLAHDKDDYESILLTKAWTAQAEWRRDPARRNQGKKAETRYVCASLWTEARRFERTRRRDKYDGANFPLFEHDIVDEEFEERAAARQTTERIKKVLSDREWEAVNRKVIEGVQGGDSFERRLFRRARTKIWSDGIRP